MAVVAIVVHENRAAAWDAARQAIDWLTARGHQVRVPRLEADLVGAVGSAVDDSELGRGADFALSLGGDGTMLRTVQLVADHGVPILGVNLGRLGYLASVDPGELTAALGAVLGDQGTRGEAFAVPPALVEERAMVSVRVGTPSEASSGTGGGGPKDRFLALNEVVLEKPTAGQPVRLSLDVGGDHLASYVADGLILASPTGSTAYAFSARGPILSPHLRALLVTPVAPHLPFDRSVVLAAGETVTVTVLGHRPASVTVDGREMAVLSPGSVVTCGVAEESLRLLSWGRPGFFRLLRAKFALNDSPEAGPPDERDLTG